MTVCRPCLNLARPENRRGSCTVPFPASSGCQIAQSAVIEIRRSLNRALAFADRFDPDLKIVNGFGADGFSGRTGFFEPDSRGKSSTISSETSCRIATPM
jgi:hypothetical protein